MENRQICSKVCGANMSYIKWLEVILLFLAIEQSRQQQEDLDCAHKDNCATSSASVAKITCEHKYGGETDVDCTCEDGGSGCPDLTGTTYTQSIDTKCPEWCTLNIGSCAFWKYVWEGNKKKCYLMTSEECKSDEANRQCPHNNSHGDPACLSDKEKSGSCADGTVPSGITCPGPINSIDDQTKYVQKWKCYNPFPQNDDDFKVDMYAELSSMPLNGFCKLDVVEQGSCKTMSPEFRFNCETVDNKQGIWKAAAEVAADEIDGVLINNILQDVTCTAPPLAFENPKLATQPGRDIVCTQEGITEDSEDSTYSIPAENYCHMLCDDYDVLSFFTDWTSDLKTRGWFYKVSDGNRETLEKADTLDCWGKRY